MKPYHLHIFDLIPAALAPIEGNRLNYSQLYSHVNFLAGKGKGLGFSHRDYSTTLEYMVKNGFLTKHEENGTKRGTKVHYEITQDAVDWHRRGVLGKDEKLKKLYQFLLFFECVTDMAPVPKAQVEKALRYVDATEDDLIQESNSSVRGTNFTEITYKNKGPIRVSKTGLKGKNGVTNWYYFLKEDGFSMNDILKFMNSTSDYKRFLIADLNYTRGEIKDGIMKLQTYGLIKPAISYDKGIRYRLSDYIAQEMLHETWHIHNIESTYLSKEWNYRKPTKKEVERLRIRFGRHGTQSILIKSHLRRMTNKKFSPDDIEIIRENRAYGRAVNVLLKRFYQKYGLVIKENFLYRDVVQTVIGKQ